MVAEFKSCRQFRVKRRALSNISAIARASVSISACADEPVPSLECHSCASALSPDSREVASPVSTINGEIAPATKLVYMLPRVRLSSGKYGQKEVKLGNAEFWPDDDTSWSNIVRKPRPPWLDIFRDFPAAQGEEPDVARGSLLISSDDAWLREHAPKIVPLLFVLSLDAGKWDTPAEAFHYVQYEAKESPTDLVSLMTKYGPLMEDASSLQLLPPLGLRCQRSVTVRLDDPFKTELVSRFEQNPNDRIVVACVRGDRFVREASPTTLGQSSQEENAGGQYHPAARDFRGYEWRHWRPRLP